MPVICLLNQKGGVGKTSTCHHLAGTLVRDQKTVLLVDNDPQSSLTQGLWGPMATREQSRRDGCRHPRQRRALPRRGYQADGDRTHRPRPRLEAGHKP
ncbi:MAG: ParA family protein [Singulisphaera sp.]